MTEPTERCATCGKPTTICVCDRIVPMPTSVRVLVLRHPQEDDVALGTAPLIALSLPNTIVKTGLSWSSLAHALGEEADHARWAVIYPGKIDDSVPPAARERAVLLLDRRGRERDASAPKLEGVVVLDGTWSQAKALWWRNAWLLKLNRIALRPAEPSIYGRARREPRREYVSTLEAVAEVLPALGESQEVSTTLKKLMRTMVQRARDAEPSRP